MNELIKITEENGSRAVSAKDLYMGLGLNYTNWSRWIQGNIIENDFFKENKDWWGFVIMTNGNETTDYAISIEFAKHIAMMARTERSHEYRNYFLECERQSKLSAPKTYIEALEAAIKSEKEKELYKIQAQKAIEEKAWIGERREATAMNTASQKAKEVKKLKIELDKSKEYASIKNVERATGGKFSWKLLRNFCTGKELEIKKVFDQNYGSVNSYPAEAWEEIYAIDLKELF